MANLIPFRKPDGERRDRCMVRSLTCARVNHALHHFRLPGSTGQRLQPGKQLAEPPGSVFHFACVSASSFSTRQEISRSLSLFAAVSFAVAAGPIAASDR
jgi:hypothetical protein